MIQVSVPQLLVWVVQLLPVYHWKGMKGNCKHCVADYNTGTHPTTWEVPLFCLTPPCPEEMHNTTHIFFKHMVWHAPASSVPWLVCQWGGTIVFADRDNVQQLMHVCLLWAWISSRELCFVALEGKPHVEHYFSTTLFFYCPVCT